MTINYNQLGNYNSNTSYNDGDIATNGCIINSHCPFIIQTFNTNIALTGIAGANNVNFVFQDGQYRSDREGGGQ